VLTANFYLRRRLVQSRTPVHNITTHTHTHGGEAGQLRPPVAPGAQGLVQAQVRLPLREEEAGEQRQNINTSTALLVSSLSGLI